MKKHSFYKVSALAALVVSVGFAACKYDVKDLEPAPKASFTVTPIAGQTNKYLVTSTSTNAFRYDWALNSGAYATRQAVDTLYFPDRGNYTIRLLTYGQGGVDSARQTLNVPNDDPAAITPQKILTGNSTKTWILKPGSAALVVGPTDNSVWWSNGAADVTAADRTCLFNDEYTFKMDGSFLFDDKGDMRVDDESGQPWPADMAGAGTTNIACYPVAQIQPQYRAWGSGNFAYQVINNNQLKVIGNGAHLGLYKAGQNGTIAAPEPENTYEIMSIDQNQLVVRKMYGWGYWKFTLVPKP
ncbi:hypothetical protein [Flaviaesturariibacter aridisoli]|uniref:PKD domain-containing protein n=1 Tax=Flaviaesturariibacter aridisoli TaxID=2545761 RepID=A0A4V2WMU3_9BACT|nr:hypothetical protein [Flaviaesturariibacter aridisoli]TCZ72972.1 hypothetical protein E0486_07875 [Flaviaesturariibacter aridisoli]